MPLTKLGEQKLLAAFRAAYPGQAVDEVMRRLPDPAQVAEATKKATREMAERHAREEAAALESIRESARALAQSHAPGDR